jgi:ABC-2 type transport system ATP-binding protein
MPRLRELVEGTPRELIAALGGEHVVEFSATAPLPAAALLALPGVSRADERDGSWRLTTKEPHRVIPRLLDLVEASGAEVSALGTHHATLDDVFLARTGRQLRDE